MYPSGASEAAASALVAQTAANAAVFAGALTLPVGWIEPNEYTNVSWINLLSIKFYSNGLKVYPMLADVSTTRVEWRVPAGPRIIFPDTGVYWVAVSLDAVLDPTKQGNSVTSYEVNVNTGNNTTGNGTIGTPWKTVEKAITEINAGPAGVYQVNLRTTDFVPSNAEGWNTASITINPNRHVKINIVARGDGSKPWLLPGMRRTGYLKANFAWSNIGDGWWKCTTGAISAAAKNTPIVFDLGTLDAEGMPTPCLALTGTLADDAAVKAAASGQPAFYYRDTDHYFYVKLASGEEPDPGINFAYVENQGGYVFLLDQPCSLMIEGGRLVCNSATAGLPGFRIRPETLELGPTSPLVSHDITCVFKGTEVYGTSGNGWLMYDCAKFAHVGCKDGYCWIDGVNQSTYYTPGSCNDPLQGANLHGFVDEHLSLHHGANGFKNQPPLNASSNTFTTHSRCNLTMMNSQGGHSNGSGVAVVGGAKCLALNVDSHSPKFVTPATDTYPASWLASGASTYDANIKSEIWGVFCRGVTRPNGKTFYVGSTSRIVMAYYKDRTTKQVDIGGVIQDGFGSVL